MDDELEDQVLYQTLTSHLKLLSKLLTVSLNNNTMVHLGRYLLKPEAMVLGLALVVLLLFCQTAEVWYRHVITRLLPSGQKIVGDASYLFKGTACGGGPGKVWQLEQGEVKVYAIQGRRPRMEDRYCLLNEQESGISLYGIFDGHGGESAAEFVEKNLFKSLMSKLQEVKSQQDAPVEVCKPLKRSPTSSSLSNSSNESCPVESDLKKLSEECPTDPPGQELGHNNNLPSSPVLLNNAFSKLLTEEILAVDKRFMTLAKQVNDLAGTTALVAVTHGSQLFVANVGDSRGVLCDSKGGAIPLSFDHKPQQIKERNRIREAGGFVTFHGVWRVAGILATSRALGDFPLKDRNLIIAEPDILTFDLSDIRPQFMILASDGLWDEFSNEEAVAYVRERLEEPLSGAKSLVQEAYRKGSVDNITVMIVKFTNSSKL